MKHAWRLKSGEAWSVGTYLWNDAQTDARLVTSGLNKTVNWIDEHGAGKVISYHVPTNHECATCHSSDDAIIPIGPKLRNLNTDVSREGAVVNQLSYFQQQGILGTVEPTQITALPHWQNTTYSLQERTRAYLDVNCAHCHRSGGFDGGDRLQLEYTTSLSNTGISGKRDEIIDQLSEGRMPLIGKTKVDVGDDHHASAKTVGFAKFTWSATLGAGLEYALGKRLSVRAEPFIEHYFKSISTDDHTKEYLFALGLSTSVVWAFRGYEWHDEIRAKLNNID